MSMKNPLTLAGIEPATFRFVAQHLNHCATAIPVSNSNTGQKHKHSPQSVVRVFSISTERCGRERTAYSSYSRNRRFKSVSKDRLSA